MINRERSLAFRAMLPHLVDVVVHPIHHYAHGGEFFQSLGALRED